MFIKINIRCYYVGSVILNMKISNANIKGGGEYALNIDSEVTLHSNKKHFLNGLLQNYCVYSNNYC